MINKNSNLGNLKFKHRFLLTLDHLLKRIGINYTKCYIYSIKLDNFALKDDPKADNLIIKECEIDDLDLFGELKDSFLSYMLEGHILIGAFLDDQWVGFNWISLKPIEVNEVERYIHFKGAYLWRAYVKEEYRRRGINKKILYSALNQIKNKYKKNEAIAITETANVPSIKSLERYGFSIVGTIKYYRFLLLKKYEENIEDEKITFLEA